MGAVVEYQLIGDLVMLRLLSLVDNGTLVAVGDSTVWSLLHYLHRCLRWLGCQFIITALFDNRLVRLLLVAAHRTLQLIQHVFALLARFLIIGAVGGGETDGILRSRELELGCLAFVVLRSTKVRWW